jgi:signal transduction histidine kinase
MGRDQLARLIEQQPTAVALLMGPEHVYAAASESYLRIAGKPVLGRPYREAFPELAGQGFFELMDEVYATGEPWASRAVLAGWDADMDGVPEPHFIDVTFAPLHDARGAVEGVTITVEVVDERVRAERERGRAVADAEVARRAAEESAEWSRRLQGVASALNQTVSPEEVAQVCVRHGMRALGAAAGSLGVLVKGASEFEVVFTTGYPPEVEERWRRFPLTAGKPVSDAVLTRAPVLLASAAEWEARYPHVAADHRHAGSVAFLATPLVVGGRALAGLAFSFHTEQAFGEGERLFLATLGEQAAQALERARLFDSERLARGTAERLQALTAAVSGALSTAAVGAATMEHGVRAVGADAGVLALLTPTGDALEVAASTGYPPEACMDRGRRWALETTIPIAEAARTGTPVCIASPDDWARRYPDGYRLVNSRSAAWAAVPLVLGGASAGALLWTFNAPRAFEPREVALMETLARVCSQALERVSLLETERRARAEAEEANRSKTEFLSAMSHELRTPLNAIAGYVDLLDAGVRGPINDAQRTDLRRIQRAQEMLLSLINDVLNFARLEAGRLEIVRTEIRPRELLRELEDLIGTQLRARGLSFTCSPCDEGLLALGDPERIRQILLNLLSNAMKFTDAGGSVAVSASAHDGRVAIAVRDTGRGIPREKLDGIFEPFVQIDRRQLEESQQGVGLGLAISRELARAMGGDLTAESTPGEGSCFTLTLPAPVAAARGRLHVEDEAMR